MLIYQFSQQWMCDPPRVRGVHWRGMLLKIGAWTVYLKGLVLALAGIAVPYIPTAKERKRGRFLTLARVPLAVLLVSLLTVIRTIYLQLYVVPESEVLITTEVTLGMVTFAMINAVLMSGRLYAAWVDRDRA